MTDLVIRQKDGWTELELPSRPSLSPNLHQLWAAIGQGDSEQARLVLEAGDLFFVEPGTEGEQPFGGKVDFQAVSQPNDMHGEIVRVWFKADGPVEVWSLLDEERTQESLADRGRRRLAEASRRR